MLRGAVNGLPGPMMGISFHAVCTICPSELCQSTWRYQLLCNHDGAPDVVNPILLVMKVSPFNKHCFVAHKINAIKRMLL